ncbi:hypothetical protein PFISCL1PPCAC_1104, partial [Pristionchus fissidentatus]
AFDARLVNVEDEAGMWLQSKLSVHQLSQVLHSMHPLLFDFCIDHLRLCVRLDEIAHVLHDALKGLTVEKLLFHLELEEDWDALIDFVDHLTPTSLELFVALPLQPDYISHLAANVDQLKLIYTAERELDSGIAPHIIDWLSMRCSNIDIFGVLSRADTRAILM